MKGLKYNMKRLPLSDIMSIVNTTGSRFGFRVMFGSYQGISRTRTIMMSIPSKVLNDRGDLIDGNFLILTIKIVLLKLKKLEMKHISRNRLSKWRAY